jgi:hypothetical protein
MARSRTTQATTRPSPGPALSRRRFGRSRPIPPCAVGRFGRRRPIRPGRVGRFGRRGAIRPGEVGRFGQEGLADSGGISPPRPAPGALRPAPGPAGSGAPPPRLTPPPPRRCWKRDRAPPFISNRSLLNAALWRWRSTAGGAVTVAAVPRRIRRAPMEHTSCNSSSARGLATAPPPKANTARALPPSLLGSNAHEDLRTTTAARPPRDS